MERLGCGLRRSILSTLLVEPEQTRALANGLFLCAESERAVAMLAANGDPSGDPELCRVFRAVRNSMCSASAA